jgi:hypothetical protein
MSIKKYKQMANAVMAKAKILKGQAIQVRTSKNTANWSSLEWFSDVK